MRECGFGPIGRAGSLRYSGTGGPMAPRISISEVAEYTKTPLLMNETSILKTSTIKATDVIVM